MKLENQINWNLRFRLLDHRWFHETLFWPPPRSGGGRGGRRVAPRGRSRCAAAAKKAFHEYHLWSRSRIPQVSIFWFSSFMNTTKGFQVFHVKIVVNIIKNFQTSQWNPGHKKKICAVYIEMTYCWFFAKNAAASVHSYGVIYSFFLINEIHNIFLMVLSINAQSSSSLGTIVNR